MKWFSLKSFYRLAPSRADALSGTLVEVCLKERGGLGGEWGSNGGWWSLHDASPPSLVEGLILPVAVIFASFGPP